MGGGVSFWAGHIVVSGGGSLWSEACHCKLSCVIVSGGMSL